MLTLHGGTLFDYYFMLDRSKSGTSRTRFILAEYVEGLYQLTLDLEQRGRDDDLLIRGTTYFLHPRTLKKIGFESIRTLPGQAFILIFNFFNLLIAFSFAKGRISIPPLSDIRTYQARVSDLLQQKERLKELSHRLNQIQIDRHPQGDIKRKRDG
jgi:hypothetical protein